MAKWVIIARIGAAAMVAVVAAVPATAATVTAQVTAKVVKPLALTALQDMQFGSMLLGPGNWTGENVVISQAGVRTCPADVVCSGSALPARFNVTGTNNNTATVTVPNVTMVNLADSTKTLTLVPNAPASVAITNSGAPGYNFSVGGSIALSSTTADGDYAGTLTVTVDYQ
jgi:hypothetical protein